jgi:hypothetical protein
MVLMIFPSPSVSYEPYEYYEFLFHLMSVWRTLGGPLWLHHAHAGSHDYAAR